MIILCSSSLTFPIIVSTYTCKYCLFHVRARRYTNTWRWWQGWRWRKKCIPYDTHQYNIAKSWSTMHISFKFQAIIRIILIYIWMGARFHNDECINLVSPVLCIHLVYVECIHVLAARCSAKHISRMPESTLVSCAMISPYHARGSEIRKCSLPTNAYTRY